MRRWTVTEEECAGRLRGSSFCCHARPSRNNSLQQPRAATTSDRYDSCCRRFHHRRPVPRPDFCQKPYNQSHIMCKVTWPLGRLADYPSAGNMLEMRWDDELRQGCRG
ncbi:hypothetical protein MRX96_049197 [Rhipicephalus microplus]